MRTFASHLPAGIYSLIGTAKLNDIDPEAYLHRILARIADHPISQIGDLPPWNTSSRFLSVCGGIAMRRVAEAVMIFATLVGYAFADEPLPPPSPVTECSTSGHFCATSDPLQKTTFVRRTDTQVVLWTIPGWHRWLFVSNDGESVVIGYDGLNLVPQDASLNLEVLFFYHHGQLVHTVPLSALYTRKSQLNHTTSHYEWARDISLDEAGRLTLNLVDGRKVIFAASTGLSEGDTPH